jgi:hypothetical protein
MLSIENLFLHHQATHCFSLVEPTMPSGINLQELFKVLTAAVRSLDLADRQHSTSTANIDSIIQMNDVPPEDHAEYMDYFMA